MRLFPGPPRVANILIAEAAERFCYYSIRSSLLELFLSLGYTDAGAVSAISFWSASCYVSPILGAILADARWGRFLTIARFGVVYCVGVACLAGAASVRSIGGAVSALAAIAVGAGGIKSCVGPFGADQLVDAGDAAITSYYFALYFCINIGSCAAFFATAATISAWNFSGAYVLCASAMGAAVIVFLVPTRSYLRAAPEGSAILSVVSVTAAAARAHWQRRWRGGSGGWRDDATSAAAHARGRDLEDEGLPLMRNGAAPVAAPLVATAGEGKLEVPPITMSTTPSSSPPTAWCGAARGSPGLRDGDVDEVIALSHILPVFATLPFFWCVFDSYGTVWQLQARRMDACSGSGGRFCIAPLSMGACNSILVLLLVPLVGSILVPAATRAGLNPTPLRRMTLGMFIAAAAFACSGLLEERINAVAAGSVPILLQVPQYVVLTVSEILVSTTGLEFAFVEAGVGMKSVVLALFFLTTFVGDTLNGIVYVALGGLPPSQLIWIVTAAQVAAALVFAAVARAYVPRTKRGAGGSTCTAAVT